MKLRQFLRATSCVVLVTFTSTFAQPTIAALQHENRMKAAAKAREPRADEKYAKTLTEIEEHTRKAKRNRGQGKTSKAETKAIRELEKNLKALEKDLDKEFKDVEKHLKDKNLAEVIKQRHSDAVAAYEAKREEFKSLVTTLAAGDDHDSEVERDAALTSLTTFFDKHSQGRKRAPLDPNKLPWRTSDVTKRLPITDAKGFKTARFGYESTHVAGAVPAGTVIPKVLSPTPTAADLLETEDAHITPAIRAKAQELGNDPLKIYLWVRNSVRFVPTYGSIQGSQDTLDKLSGNAFDTASLLIALLRAANVSARYAYGTIDVPVDQAMNWVGGVTKIEAAQQVLGQGGIPHAPVISGGVVRHIRMEHVWVEAWVDYRPSRGARHVEGDTWVPIDASFKQYAFTPAMNLASVVPFDAAGFVSATQSGATLNKAEGWFQNFNSAAAENAITSYQSQVQAYINSQKPGATYGDVLGKQAIVQENSTRFPGALRANIVVQGPRYSVLPDSLRHQFKYKLYADTYSRAADSPVWEFQNSLPKLAGKTITLSFKPATQADADLIASYLPTFPAGAPIDPNAFPRVFPAYARVTAELRVDGEVVQSGGTFPLGYELAGLGGFTQYDLSSWDMTPDDTHVAGQGTALGLSMQGIARSTTHALKARIELSRSKLLANDLTSVTGERVSGDLLTAAIWGYFANLQAHGAMAQKVAGMIDIPALSYGLFHAVAQPNKLFGVVTTSVSYPGLLMDVGHLRHVRWAKSHDEAAWIRYNRLRGQAASGFEGITPQQVFVDKMSCSDTNPAKPSCPKALSAAKLLEIAHTEGQRIYTITQVNQEAINSLQLRSETIDEIRAVVSAGKEVSVHERAVTSGGWTGAGYTVIDPSTGAGAYLIEGKANGALFLIFIGSLLALFFMFVMSGAVVVAMVAVILPFLLIAVLGLGVLLWDGVLDLEQFALDSGGMRVLVAMYAAIILATEAAMTVFLGAVIWMLALILLINGGFEDT